MRIDRFGRADRRFQDLSSGNLMSANEPAIPSLSYSRYCEKPPKLRSPVMFARHGPRIELMRDGLAAECCAH
jgi:hypothetical protein